MEGQLQTFFGKNLRAFRKSRQLSQEEFADFVGLHRTYIGGIERGERNLSLRSVERLADRIGVPPLHLLQRPAEEHGKANVRRRKAKGASKRA